MGMFDHIKFETACPVCGKILKNFQSKDGDCVLDCLEFWQVDKFYDYCDRCDIMVEFVLKEDVRKKFTIHDYEMKVKRWKVKKV
jgi:hypothetical protein